MQQHENFIMGPWEVCGMPSLAHKALASNLGLKLIQCSRLVKSKKLWLDATSSKKVGVTNSNMILVWKWAQPPISPSRARSCKSGLNI